MGRLDTCARVSCFGVEFSELPFLILRAVLLAVRILSVAYQFLGLGGERVYEQADRPFTVVECF
jgi:hypothetical protein